jgi:hypothetical protein
MALKRSTLFVTALLALISCKNQSSDSALAGNNEESSPYLAHDDIVARMEQADQTQYGSKGGAIMAAAPDLEWEAEWEKLEEGLIPLDELKGEAFDQAGFELADGAPSVGTVDLRRFDTPVKNQGREGLCTAFAVLSAAENLARSSRSSTLDVSERHLWETYRRFNLGTAVQAAVSNAIVDETVWPYASGYPAASDFQSKGVLRVSAARAIGIGSVYAALSAGHPVAFATATTRPFFDRSGVVNPYNPATNLGHAMAIVGMASDSRIDGGGYLIVKNSWGPTVGDRGYVYVPLSHCQRHYCYFYEVAGVEVAGGGAGPGPDPQPDPEPSLDASQFKVRAAFGAMHATRSGQQQKTFRLYVEASPAALAAISKVVYHIHPTFGAAAVAEVARSQSGFITGLYSTYANGWSTRGATIHLRSGQAVELPGVVISY